MKMQSNKIEGGKKKHTDKNTNLHKIYTAPGLESGGKTSKHENKNMDNSRAEDMSVNEQGKKTAWLVRK